MYGYIYQIRNLVNGKVYIGSTKNKPRKRFYQHRVDLRAGKHHSDHLQAAWFLYGEKSFEFTVLEEVELCLLLTIEQEWILKLRSFEREFGYNMSLPSEQGGVKEHSKEVKQKIAKTVRDMIETGAIPPPTNKKRIFVFDKSTQTLQDSYSSIADCAKQLDLSYKKISRIINQSPSRSYKGLLFSLTEECPVPLVKGTNRRPITINGVEYSSIKEASITLSVPYGRLLNPERYVSATFVRWILYSPTGETIELKRAIDAIEHIPNATKLGVRKLRDGIRKSYYGYTLTKIQLPA